jgi:HK97 family phage prohead protease
MKDRLLTAAAVPGLLTSGSKPTGMVIASADDGTFEGYVCAYGTPTADYRKLEIKPGAFASALRTPETVRLLWQHDSEKPIGAWTKFEERNAGLYGYGKLTAGVALADEAKLLMKDKALDGISMGWRATMVEPATEKRGMVTIKGELMESSLVTFPAFEDARIMKCALDDAGQEIDAHDFGLIEMAFHPFSCLARGAKKGTSPDIQKFERALRDAGLVSKSGAARIASLVRKDPRFVAMPEARRDDETEATAARDAEMLAKLHAALTG